MHEVGIISVLLAGVVWWFGQGDTRRAGLALEKLATCQSPTLQG